jgi:hypothetical protein
MLVVCGLQSAAAANAATAAATAEAEDEWIEEKTNKSNLQKTNSEIHMVARLSH